MRAALISLEPWDGVWRRNQHLASQMVKQGHLESLVFVEPPARTPTMGRPGDVPPGISILRPRLRIPKRAGGLRLAGRELRSGPLRDVDLLWVNDPTLGIHCRPAGLPAVYDVTDDWRSYDFPQRIIRRTVRAEDRLARTASTVVCSEFLRSRWQERYGVQAAVVQNGVDLDAWNDVTPQVLPGTGPHIGYIGTVQSQRLDVGLVLAIAGSPAVGTLHLVGPDALDEASRHAVTAHPKVILHGPVPADRVPAWTMGMDVLVCPHRVTPFTLSLDAIKAREYLVSGRPIVATPTSGFQDLESPGDPSIAVCEAPDFMAALSGIISASGGSVRRELPIMSWAARAGEFAASWERGSASGASSRIGRATHA